MINVPGKAVPFQLSISRYNAKFNDRKETIDRCAKKNNSVRLEKGNYYFDYSG
jgi:hypothetical protein